MRHQNSKTPSSGQSGSPLRFLSQIFGNRLFSKEPVKRSSDEAYDTWLNAHETPESFKASALSVSPRFTVIVYADQASASELNACVDAIRKQTYAQYELILVATVPDQPAVTKLLDRISRRKQGTVLRQDGPLSSALNEAIGLASGDFVLFCRGCDLLAPNALYEAAALLERNPKLEFIYSDEDRVNAEGTLREKPFFKPEWSPDTLMSLHYTGQLSVYRRSVLNACGRFTPLSEDVMFYDLVLRVSESIDPSNIAHIAKVLYHSRAREDADAHADMETVQSVKNQTLKRRGIDAFAVKEEETGEYRVVYRAPSDAFVSIVIPSKDNPEMLEKCLRSIMDHTEGIRYEIVLVDNGSNEEHKAEIESFLADKPFITYLYQAEPFNFSRMCNRGAAAANGNFVLFLNDDIVIPDSKPEWLSILCGHAAQPHAGAVGAKLYYPDSDRIQHLGIINGELWPFHAITGQSDSELLYFGRNRLEYNWIAVTGACLMFRKETFELAGRFYEGLPVAYNDVDLCFTLVEQGKFNVCRNDVILFHHESVSRGNDFLSEEKMERLMNELTILYDRHPSLLGRDPFYSPNLDRFGKDFRIDQGDVKVSEVETESVKAFASDFRVEVEQIQPKFALIVKGWFQSDSMEFDRGASVSLILERSDHRYFQFPLEKIVPESETQPVRFRCILQLKYLETDRYTYRIGMIAGFPGDVRISFSQRVITHADLIRPAQ